MSRFVFRLAWRETRGAWRHFGYFFACITLGVSALVGVGSFADSLERTVARLGDVRSIDSFVIENLFASDLAFLQDLYRRINQDGHAEVAVGCPHCGQEFAVDIAGDAPGGS